MKVPKALKSDIVRFRAVHGYSQEKMAELCGIHRQTLMNVETGCRPVRATTIAAIQYVLNGGKCHGHQDS